MSNARTNRTRKTGEKHEFKGISCDIEFDVKAIEGDTESTGVILDMKETQGDTIRLTGSKVKVEMAGMISVLNERETMSELLTARCESMGTLVEAGSRVGRSKLSVAWSGSE